MALSCPLISYCALCLCSAPVANAPVDPKTTVLASQLDKISKNLDHSEKDILSRLRAPLDRSDPTRDLANRLKEHEVKGLFFISDHCSLLHSIIIMDSVVPEWDIHGVFCLAEGRPDC